MDSQSILQKILQLVQIHHIGTIGQCLLGIVVNLQEESINAHANGGTD